MKYISGKFDAIFTILSPFPNPISSTTTLFILSPLSSFFLTSVFMRIIIIILLIYTLYLNSQQTTYLRNASQLKITNEISTQLNINIICSYIFTLFIGLLVIFVLKSFF